jgi:hypothetical protein
LQGSPVASDERIEAYVLYVKDAVDPEGNAETAPRASAPTTAIVSLRSFIEDGGTRLKLLISRVCAGGPRTFRLTKVHPAEISKELLETIGFRAGGGHRLYAARARSD